MSELRRLIELLWDDYVIIAPQAARIHALLAARGEAIVNDHIALRTYGVPAIGIDVLARAFVKGGYRACGNYEFPDKKLIARHYEHSLSGMPKVFISELEVHKLSPACAHTIDDLIAAMPANSTEQLDFVARGRPWPVSFATYQQLLAESEYAAWVAAFGFRANHFTVDVGALHSFAGLVELDDFLLQNGFALNTSGGIIKGSPAALLEQSSTLAEEVDVEFSDGTYRIPSCYYEFARRYPMADGAVFQGFVPASADKLFESTNVRR